MDIDPEAGLIVLAAGRSSRFGSDKLMAPLNGRPLVEWVLRAGDEAGFGHKFLVRRSDAPPIAPPPGWTVVVNANADQGISSSIRQGVAAAVDCSRVVVALADMPFVSAAHLRGLAQAPSVTFTRYPDGTTGVPAAFPETAFAKLLALEGDRGARGAFSSPATVDHPEACHALDIDTRRQLAQARSLFALG